MMITHEMIAICFFDEHHSTNKDCYIHVVIQDCSLLIAKHFVFLLPEDTLSLNGVLMSTMLSLFVVESYITMFLL